MRKILYACLIAALALPAVSIAARRAPGDGTLSVKDARGLVLVTARGGLIGRCAKRCEILIDDPVPGDGSGPVVFGDDFARQVSDTAMIYRGNDIRFRIIGGAYRVKVTGVGINLSAVGKGSFTLDGAGTGDDGSYAVDGGEYLPLPDERTRQPLGAPAPAGG